MNTRFWIKMVALAVAITMGTTELAMAQRGGRGGGPGASVNMRSNGFDRGYSRGYNRGWSNGNWNRGYGYGWSGPGRVYGGYGYGAAPYWGGYRYSSGYRGYPGRVGLGVAFGPYGYGYFPWYRGLGVYGGLAGINSTFGNGIYGSGYYDTYGNRTTVYQTQPQRVADDYVPQVNTTTAQLVAGASGNAVLGVTMDGTYPQAAVIRDAKSGMPAEAAGMQRGDMIASIDDVAIHSPSDVVNAVASHQPGDSVHIEFVRPILRSQVRAAAPAVQR